MSKAFKTKAATPEQHLNEHNADVKACVEAFKLLREDKLTVDRLNAGATANYKNFSEVVATSKFASEQSISQSLLH